MRQHTHPHALCACSLAALLVALSGCTDNNYDLGDLDATIAVGNDQQGLALPGNNSTHYIILDDLLDLDDTESVQTDADGNYIFTKDGGTIEPAHPSVDPVIVSRRTALDSPILVDIKPEGYDLLPDGYVLPAITGLSVEQRINTFNYSGEKPDAVVDLTTADVEGTVSVRVVFDQGNLPTVVSRFKTLDIDFPPYMAIEPTATQPSAYTLQGNRLSFSNVPTSSPLVINARLTRFDFGRSDATDLLALRGDSVVMHGQVRLHATFDTEPFAKGAANLDNLRISGHTEISDIRVVAATGRFAPDITLGDINDIVVDDTPDFLDDPAVNIHLDNPCLEIVVNSNVDVAGVINAMHLTSYVDEGKTQPIGDVTFGGLPILANATTGLLICRTVDADVTARAQAMSNEVGHTVTPTIVPTLSSLIGPIPKHISVDLDISADSTRTGTVKLGNTDYVIEPSYKFYAPLALNHGSQIVYRDTLDGWHDDLDDLRLSRDAVIEVTCIVENRDLDMDFNVAAEAIKADGTAMSPNDVAVVVANDVSARTDTPVTVTITQHNEQAFRQIDGLAFRITTHSTADGQKLNQSTQRLKVKDIAVHVKGKLIIEDNDD